MKRIANEILAVKGLTFTQYQSSLTDLNVHTRWKQEAFFITKQWEEITLAY